MYSGAWDLREKRIKSLIPTKKKKGKTNANKSLHLFCKSIPPV